MTKVYAEFEGGRCLLNLEGHATGSPEVCAAVSGIVYALAGYVTNAERDGHAEIYSMIMDSGRALLHFHGDDRVCGACEMAFVGLMQIEKQHPEHIKVNFAPD